jgi:hypothetical protein
MTIQSPAIIKTMLANKGTFPGDPPMARIYQYASPEGKTAFAAFVEKEHDDTAHSPYVVNPVLLLEDGQLTKAGRLLLEDKPAQDEPSLD